MASRDNAHTLRRLLEEAFGKGDLSVADEVMAADCVEHQNGAPGNGPAAVKEVVTRLHESFPDLELHVHDIVETGDYVWARAEARGTDTGGVGGMPPTGRSFDIDLIDIVRFRDGKIAEHWGVADRLGLLQQIGALPEPTQERQAA
jgi:predicted ester cyclase